MKVIQIAPVIVPETEEYDPTHLLYALCENGRVVWMDPTDDDPRWSVIDAVPDEIFATGTHTHEGLPKL